MGGLHPREFVFDKELNMCPAGDANGFVDMSTALRRKRNGPKFVRRRGQSILASPIDISDDEQDGNESESDDDEDAWTTTEKHYAPKRELCLWSLLELQKESDGC